MKYYGRRKPYTEIGIKRIPCSRCSKPSEYQWQACANGRYYVAMCKNCDIKINGIVLDYLKVPNKELLMKEYRRKMLFQSVSSKNVVPRTHRKENV